MLLGLISESSESGTHGYAVYLAVQKRYGVRLGASTLYPRLTELEQQALIEPTWEVVGGKPRRVFRITPKGKTLLREYRAELKILVHPSVQV